VGLAYGYLEAPDSRTLAAAVEAARGVARNFGGYLVVERAEPELKAAVDVWGPLGPELELMRRLKAEFDPKGILNPGRFVGGI
jgi:glycolate oxidase FAD binding subunit